MYLVLGHHSVHSAAASWTPVSWQLGAVESSVVATRSSGNAEATVRLVAAKSVGHFVAGSTLFRPGYVFCWWVTAALVNLVVRALIPTSL